MWKLILAFTVIPAMELYLLIQLGKTMGAGATVGLIMVTGFIGAWLAKREGLAVLSSIMDQAKAGFPSGDRIIEGLMVLVGGALLLTPGVMTDLFGFALIVPFSRALIAPLIKRALLKKVGFVSVSMPEEKSQGPLGDAPEPEPQEFTGPTPFDHPSF